MTTQCLTRRKTQLELLALLCAQRRRACVVLPDGGEANTRFLALEADGVLLEWPLNGVEAAAAGGATVTVLFEQGDCGYRFRTETTGRVWWQDARRGQVAAWRLRLPLRIEPRRARRHLRLSLAGLPPVFGRFSSATDPLRAFTVQLRNLSPGGLQGSTDSAAAGILHPGDLFWVEMDLPDQCERCVFLARIAHAQREPRRGVTVFGCTFCGGEDPLAHEESLARVERFLDQCRHTRVAAACSAEGV